MNRLPGQTRAETAPTPERFDRGLQASLGLHAILAALILSAPAMFPSLDAPWGSESGGGGISVDLAGSSFAIPLPAAPRVNPDASGNDSPGFYQPPAEVAPPPPAETETPTDAEPIPESFELAAEEPAPPETETEPAPAPTPPPPEPRPVAPATPRPAPEAPRTPAPDNAVPFGEGGQPAVNSGLSESGGTGAGFDGGDGAFGQENGTYVRTITQRISREWIQGTIRATLRTAPRAYVGFDILRDGTVRNVRLLESSGEPEVDESAVRAVYASNPLTPLPAAYRGSSVSVRFWFELRR